jgi:hypothetical protein
VKGIRRTERHIYIHVEAQPQHGLWEERVYLTGRGRRGRAADQYAFSHGAIDRGSSHCFMNNV